MGKRGGRRGLGAAFALPLFVALAACGAVEAAKLRGRAAAEGDTALATYADADGPGENREGIPEPGTVHYDVRALALAQTLAQHDKQTRLLLRGDILRAPQTFFS